MKTIADGKYVVLDDGTTWPLPMDEPDGGLEYRLRYADDAAVLKDRFLAASIVNAYRALIQAPLHRRAEVFRALRVATKEEYDQWQR